MEDSEGVVGGYAAWALGRIGGSQAKQSLEASLLWETDELAKKEIQAALSYSLHVQIKNFPRIEDIVWVKSSLYAFHDVQECVVHSYREICFLIKANAVLS